MHCVCVCVWWGRYRKTIENDRYGNVLCCGVRFFWFPASHRKKTHTHTREVFFVLLPGRARQRELTLYSLIVIRPTISECIVWVCVCDVGSAGDQECDGRLPPPLSPGGGVRACPWQAAVIRGAQRTEFIRLSRGREAFLPATLQFVSHTWRHVTAWMRFLRHSFLAPMFARRGVCMNRITSFSPSVTLIRTCVAFKDFLRRSASLKNWPLKKCWHRTVD